MSKRSAELFERAQQVLAGGVSRNTLLRTPHPFYVKKGFGCRVVDVDGVERIDFANNMASLIHGHAHPAVVEALVSQFRRGSAFTLATEAEIELAELICSRSPGFEKIRFMNSGTEAMMAAVKAARAYTGRPGTAKIEGAYHGAYTPVEVSQAPTPEDWGPAERPNSVPLAVGTPSGILRDIVVLPYNNAETVVAVLDEHRDELACVVIDLMPHRLGLVPADDDYVQAVSNWTRAHGALLIFDEVITFRTELGGMQERYKISPDLTAMGKIIGGGLPVGALAGREEVMAVFTSQNGATPKFPQSGTFSANPVTMNAGLAAMKLFDEEAVGRLNRLGHLARTRVREAIAIADAPASVTGISSLLRIHMQAEAPRDYRSTYPTPQRKAALDIFIQSLYDEGIVPIHSGFITLSTPMGEAEIDRLAEAVLASLRKVRPMLEQQEAVVRS